MTDNPNLYKVKVGRFSGFTGQNSYAIAIGYQAGYTNQGSNSIAIGCNAQAINATNTIVIGSGAMAKNDISNQLVIGFNANNNVVGGIYASNMGKDTIRVGINTNNPLYTQDISGDIHISKRIIDNSNRAGDIGQVLTSTGEGFNWVNPSQVGVNSYWNALGANIYNNNPGYVGIGISSPQYTLDVSGTTNMTGTLFVNTNTLYVNSTSNIVGINRYPTYNLDVSGNFRTTNLIDRLDLSGSNGQVLLKDNSGLIWSNKLTDISNSLTSNINKTTDLSNTVTTLSAKVTDVSNSLTTNINKTIDLSNTVTTLSAKVTDISNSLTANINKTTDLSNTVTNIYNNLDISNNNTSGTFYPTFVSGTGQQRLFIDGSNTQLVYNPGLNRLGIGRDPIYNLDISGSLRTTNIVDTDNSSGSIGQVLTRNSNGIKWVDGSSVGNQYWMGSGTSIYNTNSGIVNIRNTLDMSNNNIRDVSSIYFHDNYSITSGYFLGNSLPTLSLPLYKDTFVHPISVMRMSYFYNNTSFSVPANSSPEIYTPIPIGLNLVNQVGLTLDASNIKFTIPNDISGQFLELYINLKDGFPNNGDYRIDISGTNNTSRETVGYISTGGLTALSLTFGPHSINSQEFYPGNTFMFLITSTKSINITKVESVFKSHFI